MAEASIPVDLFNPGQVFACLGFLEAADLLCGDAEGGFDWTDPANVRFILRAAGDGNPFAAVLEFLANATVRPFAPVGYVPPPPKKKKEKKDDQDEADETGPATRTTVADSGRDDAEDAAEDANETQDEAEESNGAPPALDFSETFHAKEGDPLSLPIRMGGGNRPTVELGHWADASGRNDFKLYSGNRSAHGIARAMIHGTRGKSKAGAVETRGIAQLWAEQREGLTRQPFDVVTPMGGSFNFDPRGAWTAIDAGYSPNEHKHRMAASPVVEMLAAWGFEHARPNEFDVRKVRYAAWGMRLSPPLARAALFGGLNVVPLKIFRFELALSGKNKVVTFSERETDR